MSTLEERMRAAFELHELAVAMRREALKRENPDESDAEIEARLRTWLLWAEMPQRRIDRPSETIATR